MTKMEKAVIRIGFKDHRTLSNRMFFAANKDCTILTQDPEKAYQFAYESLKGRRTLVNYAYGPVSDYWRGRRYSEGPHWMDFEGKFEGTWVSDVNEVIPKASIRWESKDGIKILGHLK